MDDDQAFHEVLEEILDYLGYSSVFVCDGKKAAAMYEKALNSGKTFDLVIMDLKVEKGTNGEEGAKLILELDSNAKIIIASGQSNHPIMRRPKNYGIHSVLLKPFSMPTLEALLVKILS